MEKKSNVDLDKDEDVTGHNTETFMKQNIYEDKDESGR